MPLVIICSFFALPIIEIGAFILASYKLSLIKIIGVTLVSALFGLHLLKINRSSAPIVIKSFFDGSQDILQHVRGHIGQILSGILLIIPGFITDTIGLIIFFSCIKVYLLLLRKKPTKQDKDQNDAARLKYDFNADYKDISNPTKTNSNKNKYNIE
ncbi:MAG: hypothetical protein CMM25_03790 [Rhodospirillaceae bacterium]|nr:hypothetical protein [Rhodospirillaceae bacterium]|tara:strand:+ start:1557 stop:2024 length:468 start_codon:yes stop_codon:yes gene_type:complete